MNSKCYIHVAQNLLHIRIQRYHRRYCYRADETDSWFWISRADILLAIRLSYSSDPEILTSLYSHWCSFTGRKVSKKTNSLLDRSFSP